MENMQKSESLSTIQKIIVSLLTFSLVIVLLFLRGGYRQRAPLEQLVANSIEPNQAFSEPIPIVLEFYADWCETCIRIAPTMLNLEKEYRNDINLVMLNVDNPRWQDYIEKYDVQGIPQFNFFDKSGIEKGKQLGFQNEEQFTQILNELLLEKDLSNLKINNNISNLNLENLKAISNEQNQYIGPRNHG